jgi:carboxypeptidase family protein
MRGVVVDPSNRPIPAVTVAIKRNGDTIETATTDDIGLFSFDSLPEGTYQVTASVTGFQTGHYNVILLHKTTRWKKRLRITLAVGSKRGMRFHACRQKTLKMHGFFRVLAIKHITAKRDSADPGPRCA